MRVLLAHPGTQHSHRLARELARHSLLGEFWTGLALADNGAGALLCRSAGMLPGLRGLRTRIVPGVPQRLLRTRPLTELRALWRLRHGEAAAAVLHERNERFQLAISQRSIESCDATIGFDTSSWILARRCRDAGTRFYLDRTIAHPAALTRLIRALAGRYPRWVEAIDHRPDAVSEAERIEHELADRIVVGGSFARDSLIEQGIEPRRICVNPYGVDWDAFASPARARSPEARPFRFLFAGSFTARKGAPVLLDAWRELSGLGAELWVAGHVAPRERALIPALPGLRLLGAIAPSRMATVYASCDAFVLPSLFEGFGLVILEALAAGLTVISTRNTGAVDVIQDPILGEVIEPGAPEPLAEAMRRRLNSGVSHQMVRARAHSLRERFSWRAYGDRWVRLLAGEA